MNCYRIYLFILIVLLCQSCESVTAQDKAPDPSLANVFAALDGTWIGVFYIYEWKDAQQNKKDIPAEITPSYFDQLSLTLIDSVQVTQVYTSTSPYIQTVSIEDKYLDQQGNIQIVESAGVNKIAGKKLWCIVDKPDEKVIHSGTCPSKNTIIWQRSEKNPLKVEYFIETVEETTYDIMGYGYYGEDNTKKNPKTWFKSRYFKQ